MAERLKQIWSGFEATTSRHLTGKGVDNIIVPHRLDPAEEDLHFLPEDFEAPSERAFSALRERRKSSGKKRFFGKKADDDAVAQSMSGAPQSVAGDALFQALRATAMRTERTDIDYEYFLASDAGKAVRRKTRKKFLGLF